MKFEDDLCPCIHRVKTGPRMWADVPAKDCNACGGSGYAEFMVPTNPTDVRRVS